MTKIRFRVKGVTDHPSIRPAIEGVQDGGWVWRTVEDSSVDKVIKGFLLNLSVILRKRKWPTRVTLPEFGSNVDLISKPNLFISNLLKDRTRFVEFQEIPSGTVKESVEDLDDIMGIQCNEPSVVDGTDSYMVGLANGLIIAKAVVTDSKEEPEFFDIKGVVTENSGGSKVLLTDMIDFFEERTAKHIQRVIDASSTISSVYSDLKQLPEICKKHDSSKYSDEEIGPYIYLTWKKKCESSKIPYEYPQGVAEMVGKACQHHVTVNSHHPEYWHVKKVGSLPEKGAAIDASSMDDLSLAEMVCDWYAMGQELGNTVRSWYEQVNGKRFLFTQDQQTRIENYINTLEESRKGVEEEMVEAWKDHPDPSGFLRAAHSPENSLLVWWYQPFTGEFRQDKSPTANHKDVFLSNEEVGLWVRGRVFQFRGKVYLMIYFNRVRPLVVNFVRDLYDLCRRAIGRHIDVTMDMNGDDISDLFESWKAYKIECSPTGRFSAYEKDSFIPLEEDWKSRVGAAALAGLTFLSPLGTSDAEAARAKKPASAVQVKKSFGLPVRHYTEKEIINSIVGEAEGEGERGMLAVAHAIRNRAKTPYYKNNILHGVFGRHSDRIQKAEPKYFDMARRAWGKSATEPDPTFGAIVWGSDSDVKYWVAHQETKGGRWFKNMEKTVRIGNHTFFVDKRGSKK